MVGHTQGNRVGSIFLGGTLKCHCQQSLFIFSILNYLVPRYWDFLGFYRVNELTSHDIMNVQPKRVGFSTLIRQAGFLYQLFSTLTTLSPNCFHSCSVILVNLEFVVTAMSVPPPPPGLVSWPPSLSLYSLCWGGGVVFKHISHNSRM